MVIKRNLFRTTATSAQILDAYTSLLSGSIVVYHVTEDNFVNINNLYICVSTQLSLMIHGGLGLGPFTDTTKPLDV